MNKLSKTLIVIIVLLVIALATVSFLYFDMKKTAQDNLNLYLDSKEKITQLLKDNPELQNIDSLKE